MADHALLSASKMSIWENCAGAPALWQRTDVVETSSSYAQEGTLAHHVAELILTGELESAEDYAFETQPADDFCEAVEYYCDYVTRVLLDERKLSQHVETKIEKRVHMAWHDRRDLFGTVDCIIYTPLSLNSKGNLHIIDYKHGAGVSVDVGTTNFKPNRQLMYYLLATIETLACDYGHAIEDTGFTVEDYISNTYEKLFIHIVQPRVYGKGGSLEITIDQLLRFARDFTQAVQKAESQLKCEDADLTLQVGDWCRWCKVRDVCPAKFNQTIQEATADFDMIHDLNDAQSLDSSQLSELLFKAEKVKRMLQMLEANAVARLKAGESIPGFNLVEKRGVRKWIDTDSVISAMTDLKLNTSQSLILPSPAQLIKKLPRAAAKQLNELVVTESSGIKLGKDND